MCFAPRKEQQLLLGGSIFRKRKNLARINQVGITDLFAVLVVNHPILQAITIGPARDPPQAVARLNDITCPRLQNLIRAGTFKRQFNTCRHLVGRIKLIGAQLILARLNRFANCQGPVAVIPGRVLVSSSALPDMATRPCSS